MSFEKLGQALYIAITKDHNISAFLKRRQLNILQCDEADIEYDEFDMAIPTTNVNIEKHNYTESVILDDGAAEGQFHLHDGIIYNEKEQRVGYYENWQDADVPMRFKDADENILDPIEGKPIREYILEHQYGGYHNLSTKCPLRAYRYDICFNKLIKTGDVR